MKKDEVIESLENTREEFLDAIEGLEDSDLETPGVIGDWSIKDLMAHISAWEAEMVKLLWQAKQGERPTTIHFQNQSVDKINATWSAAARQRPLERVQNDFEAVRKQTARRVETFSERDLIDPKRLPWLEDKPLWTWIAIDSYDHEAEHTRQIRQWREHNVQ